MTNRTREPRGVPTGGRFAPHTHAEADVSLVPIDLSKVDVVCHGCGQTISGADYLDHDQDCNDDMGGYQDTRADEEDPFVFPGRIGHSFEDQLAKEAELAERNGTNPYSAVSNESWSSITAEFGTDHAKYLYETYPSASPEMVGEIAQAEWEAVTTDVKVRRRLMERGVKPADFAHADRNVRMSACQARGDLVFENELLSDAFDLSNHGVLEPGRVMGPPSHLRVRSGTISWSSLGPGEQLAYIDGYAAGVEAIADARRLAQQHKNGHWAAVGLRDRGPGPDAHPVELPVGAARARFCGWSRAISVAMWHDDFNNRLTDEAVISHLNPDGRSMRVTDVRAENLPGRTAFTGTPQEGSRRFTTDGETVPLSSSARVMFEIDQVLPPR